MNMMTKIRARARADSGRAIATALAVLALLLSASLTVGACDGDASSVDRCTSDSDCPDGRRCFDGVCAEPTMGDTRGDGATDASTDTPEDTRIDDSSTPDTGRSDTQPSDTGGDTSAPDVPDTIDATDQADVPPTGCDACTPEQTCCNDRCVDLQSSAAHCGACGASCLAAQGVAAASCVEGACQIDACDVGLRDCDEMASNGCEVDTETESDNCGACGATCAPGQDCMNGTCACPGGTLGDDNNCGACGVACGPFETCGGASCVCESGDLNDDANCGGCGNACPAGETCNRDPSTGDYACGCPSGLISCAGVCVDPLTDSDHCNACFNECAAGSTCSSGVCTCPTGSLNDNQNCGGCGNICPSGTTCTETSPGVWECSGGSCPSGLERCSGQCVDTTTDPAHCGGCGTTCPSGFSCEFSLCRLDCPDNRADCDLDPTNGCETVLDTDGRCGTECATRRDCGFWGDTCSDDGGEYHCRCDNGLHCRPGETCEGFSDSCVCADGNSCGQDEVCCATVSGRVCANLDSDPIHCGMCNRPCGVGETCVAGTCQ